MWVPSLDWEHPWRRKWQPTPVFLPGKSHEPRSLAGDSHGVTKRSLWGQSMGSHTPLGHTTDHSTHTAGSVLNFVNRGCWRDTAKTQPGKRFSFWPEGGQIEQTKLRILSKSEFQISNK